MKILTVIRHPVGGIRTYIKYTYGHLDRSRFRFTIVTVACREAKILRDDLRDVNARIIEVPGKSAGRELLAAARRALAEERYDAIHSHGFTAGLLAVAGNIFARVPHVITSHDVFRDGQFRGWLGRLKKFALYVGLRQADIIQSVGHDAQANLIEALPWFKNHPERLRVIVNGIVTESSADAAPSEGVADTSIKQELGISDDLFLFGFLGRFMPQKGFENLIAAVEELSRDEAYKNRFKVIAVNDGSFIREYKDIVAEKGIGDSFIFYGFSTRVFHILSGLDALVMPSLWEAYSLVAMEAFLCGCPLIATECTGLREAVEGTPAIRIRVNDSHSIAQAMRDVIDNPEHYKISAMQYVPEARQKYDVRKTASELDRLFHDLIPLTEPRIERGTSAPDPCR